MGPDPVPGGEILFSFYIRIRILLRVKISGRRELSTELRIFFLVGDSQTILMGVFF